MGDEKAVRDCMCFVGAGVGNAVRDEAKINFAVGMEEGYFVSYFGCDWWR